MNWHTHSPKSSWKVMFWCWSHIHFERARSSRWLPQRWLQLCSTSPHPSTWGPLLYHTRWKVEDGAHCLLLSLSFILLFPILSFSTVCVIVFQYRDACSQSTGRIPPCSGEVCLLGCTIRGGDWMMSQNSGFHLISQMLFNLNRHL